MKLHLLLPACAAVAGLLALAPAVHASGSATPPPASTPDWSAPGPDSVAVDALANTTIYRPTPLTGAYPVILWGNGTGATPKAYDGLLRHLASYGFIVAAANTTMSNSGKEMLAGARWLRTANSTPGSVYQGKVDLDRVGAAGHSQGGAGAINAGGDPIVDATLALEPGPLAAPAALRGPVLFLAGEKDRIVNPDLLVKPLYAKAGQVPAWYAELIGAGHFTPVPDGGGFRAVITAWFLYNLTGEHQAADQFTGDCGICRDPAYTEVRRNGRAGG